MRGVRTQLVVLSLFTWGVSFFHSARANLLCEVSLSSPNEVDAFLDPSSDQTDRLIAYLESLLEERIIGEEHLSRFILGLEKDRVLNPLWDQEGSAADIHWGGIQEFIDKGELDQDRLLEWARLRRMDRDRIQVIRNNTRMETQDLYSIKFHPVRVGSFMMGPDGEKEVQLTHPIAVMSTQVTQKHWVEIMGENPSEFARGDHSVLMNLDGKSIELQPDHPVENVSWWSTLVFANRLSEKNGYPPVYDLTNIRWAPDSSAKNGTLHSSGGDLRVYANGAVRDPYLEDIYYQAEGYRLPTEAEQEYLLRAGGMAHGNYHFGDDVAELKKYGWYFEFADYETHPVAQLAPLILDGKEFYDLHGNVAEWSWDFYSANVFAERNPVGPKEGTFRLTRGGSYHNKAPSLRSHAKGFANSNSSRDRLGFRLVRTIKNSKGRRTR